MSRKEIEFVVEDFDKAKLFLQSIGFTPVVFYEKFRTTYEFHETHIMLDELPYGQFVEIEGENISTLQEIAKQLNLNWNAMVKAGYHALFDRAASGYNLERWNLSFESVGDIKFTPEDLQISFAD